MGNLCQCPESGEFIGGEFDLANEKKLRKDFKSDHGENEESTSLIKSGNNFFKNTSNRCSRMKSSKRKLLPNEKFEIQTNNFNINLQKSFEITHSSIVNECIILF